MKQIQYLSRADKPNLAYVLSEPSDAGKKSPLVIFCGGYRSDMNGTKATYLEKQCQARGQGFIRFDYSGHGLSEGKFADGTIGSWKDDALDIIDKIASETTDKVVLAGSSMGGWIALLSALARTGIIRGVVGIAAAPDFTEDMYSTRLDEKQKQQLDQDGFIEIPNDYSDQPYIFTKNFYEEARNNLILNQNHIIDFPIRLVQGIEDKDVPWTIAAKIAKVFDGAQVDITFIDDADHSISRPEDLELIDIEIKSISGIF